METKRIITNNKLTPSRIGLLGKKQNSTWRYKAIKLLKGF